MSIKLRELIRAVRACKTAQEERAVIAKECALIRTAFKENNIPFRHRNVAKLLFIHMLGYPSHFGQMECLKLIASPNFPEKRIGYLALMLLLDEKTEVLQLVTNSLKNDLQHSNQFIAGLSLTSVGNLATADMGRMLAPDIDRHLKSGNPYLRKKACLTMVRVFKRVPELIEDFVDKVIGLLKDRSHGVLITGVQLMTEIVELQPEHAPEFVRLVPSLVRLLRNLLNLGYSPEHDVAGITDPFLQVKLLKLLTLLGAESDDASDAMNDILAQVATNTETNRNAGNAILYECVKAIMTIKAESGLRVLAVNILGRFLLNRDNNIRYVALNTLATVVSEDVAAVQRHRTTIIDCLKDPDVSIRQRALELIYQLVNPSNVEEMVREMLNYLVVAPGEHRQALCSKIMVVVEKFAPSRRWQVDTLITMLSIAGNHCDESISSYIAMYLAVEPALHAYVTHKLFAMLKDEMAQLALVHVALWCFGEFGELLLRDCVPPPVPPSANADGTPAPEPAEVKPFPAATVPAVLKVVEAAMKSHLATPTTKSFVLTTLAKLTSRFGDEHKPPIEELISSFQTSMNLELQQRSTEYLALLGGQWDSIRPEMLTKMPIVDEETLKARRAAARAGRADGLRRRRRRRRRGQRRRRRRRGQRRPRIPPLTPQPAAAAARPTCSTSTTSSRAARPRRPSPRRCLPSPTASPRRPRPPPRTTTLAAIFAAARRRAARNARRRAFVDIFGGGAPCLRGDAARRAARRHLRRRRPCPRRCRRPRRHR